MRVLITDSDNRSALAATRSLGRAGYDVTTAGEHRASLAAYSKHSNRFCAYPSPHRDPEGFVTAVLEAVERLKIELLLPMTEVTTLLLTEHRARLPAHCTLPFPDQAALKAACDKGQMVSLAQRLGVPTPATLTVNAPDEIDAIAKELEFPIVVKPARSRVRTPTGWISTSVSYAHDLAALRAHLVRLPLAAYPLLLQERIAGPGVGFFACYANGKLVAQFAHRRLREKPPSGGVSVLRESIAVDADALQHGTRLLDALGWHGVAMVEFKRDLRDDSLRLMEINARFWGSLQLAIDAGVDFPLILAQVAAGTPPQKAPVARPGVRCRWLLGHLDVLLTVLTRRRQTLNLPQGFPSRAALLAEVLHFWRKDQYGEIFRPEDPKPGLLELKNWLSGQ
jgi:predicted ATP-grasp superfamily ATP-dependent carboligase